ncbi:MAG: flagellar hook-length control protein FliK, partial [Clostridia bacterium]|nr:flagellar hook-length control protein FliK [Clostridia bacterium]
KEDEEIFSDKENVKDKKEHKNVKEQKVETRNEFDIQNGSENKVEVSDDLKDVIEYNSASDSVTDRYIETIEVAKQMVKGIEVKLSENVQEMHVKLDPENLGKVNLKIVAENGLVTAKFEAESQKVKEIIESNLSLLKESLEKRGIQISNLEVSVGQNMQGNSSQRNLDEMRKIALEKNPHKILGKGIKIFSNTAEINNSELKKRGLFMTRSKVNYIA